jgi:hypothetical protein
MTLAATKPSQRPTEGRTEPSDAKVVVHPGFRNIPPCAYPLATDEARQDYDRYARLLFDHDRLTVDAHRILSSASSQFDVIILAQREGRPLRASWYVQRDKLIDKLKLDDLNSKIARPEQAQANKFSRCGFSARRR